MNIDNFNVIGLIISTWLIVFLSIFISKSQKNKNLKHLFLILLGCLFICCFSLLLQVQFSKKYNINPIYFDYIVYIGSCFMPVIFCLVSFTFSNTKLVFNKKHLLLFIVPIISLLVLWTNDLHHLFYIKYSIYTAETVFGPYFYVYSIYSYAFIIISVINLFIYSIKNSGFFSKQSIFLLLGVLCPLVPNLLMFFNVLQSTIYVTPICFAFSIAFFTLAIFKFKFLSISPIALQRIVDNISDGYIVLDEDDIVIDYNKTFITTFCLDNFNIRNLKLNRLLGYPVFNTNTNNFHSAIDNVKDSASVVNFEEYYSSINKYFNIEISRIYSNKIFLGTLILFKDITQHTIDMQTIKSSQDLLMEKERLASLGQLIGGIAHNLKTPIMSISGASEGLSDLAKEYDASIDDSEVTADDHHSIAKDMFEWIEKIKVHTRYMSDVITAVKGQAVALSETQSTSFTIEELMKHIDILMKHELKNALIDLNISINVDSNLYLRGNINSLVQVLNNIISNSIQAYNGEPNNSIDLIINKNDSNLIISIEDYACGMPKEIVDKLFKEMVTTKGKNGTGLGLFMSYSNIRAHFNGNITVSSVEGKGTRFVITIPI